MEHVQLGDSDYEGRNNVYVLSDDGATTLVDTGVNTPETYAQLESGLEALGTSVQAVDRVFITHWHRDHVGLAEDIARESGATVYVHKADEVLVRNSPWEVLSSLYPQLFDSWGMPAEKRDRLVPILDEEDPVLTDESVDLRTFEDGDQFVVGDHTLEVVHTPGHTAGQSCFAFEGQAGPELFAADAILPVYTPNIGGADIRVEEPLQCYLDTLTRLIERDFVRAWPGHRDPIDDPSGRAIDIITHHRERASKILDVLDDDPVDAWTVSSQLFGELDGIHILHGPGEAYAHLDHLARHGLIDETPDGYVNLGSGTSLKHLFPSFEENIKLD
ncbi:MAG: MBL fold metallo-hydrolase [Halobacteriota archaeon]